MSKVFSKALADIYGCELTREYWPILLMIGITNKCNIGCYMCGIHFNDTAACIAKYKDMPEELFLKIEPLIRKAHYIILGASGEPTVSYRFLQRVRRIRQLNPTAHLTTYTNGVLLSSLEFAEEMIPLFDCIHLSLNGIKSYAEITGGHSFENIKQSLENIKLVRKRLDKPCQLVIGFVLMRKNLQDIVEAAVLAKEMGADKISYTDLWVRNEAMKSESARHNPELTSLMLKEIQKATQVGIPVHCDLWPSLPETDRELFSLKPKSEPGDLDKIPPPSFTDTLRIFRIKFTIDFEGFSLPCYNPWERVNVLENGNVVLCPNGSTHIGNLKEKSFEEIWLGDEARRYREGIITGHYYKHCACCRLILKDKPSAYEKISNQEMREEKSDITFSLFKEKIERSDLFDLEIVKVNSMSPFLKCGDTVLVKKIEPEDLKRGDVIVYKTDHNLRVRRYIQSINGPFKLIVKADNSHHFEMPISREQFIGKIIAIKEKEKAINLEQALWKIINYLLASIGTVQGYAGLVLRHLRKTILKDKKFPLGKLIKRWFYFILSLPLKIIVYIAKIATPRQNETLQ